MTDAIEKPGRGWTEAIRLLRTVIQVIPYGIGSAMDVQIFDRIAERDRERAQAFVDSLARQVAELCARQADYIRIDFLDTDEFRFVLREVFTSAAREHRQEKVDAYRAVLLNAMHEDPRVEFDRKAFFLDALTASNIDHLRALKHLGDLHRQGKTEGGPNARELAPIIAGSNSCAEEYTAAVLAFLDDRKLVTTWAAFRRGLDRTLDFSGGPKMEMVHTQPKRYSLSQLGAEFLRYITTGRDGVDPSVREG